MKTNLQALAPWAFTALATVFAAAAPVALAHDNAHKKTANAAISTDTHPFGQQGDPKHVTRTVNIDMSDTMRFSPLSLNVKQGETIKFVVQNKGKVMHEMVIGTLAELKAHGEMMKKHPGMEHDEPYMAHVQPGKKAVMLWKFTQPGEFHYGCLVPGHFEAGMIGKITVAAK